MNMTNYKIVSGRSVSEMEMNVNKLLSEGWVCQGGVSFQIIVGTVDYRQAMVIPSVSDR
jgi:hypothetical protein